jgi:hypothetical protein
VADEICIVRGRPTDEELAAIVGVLYATTTATAAAAARAEPDELPASRWVRSARPTHPLGPRGRDAWRASVLPGRH